MNMNTIGIHYFAHSDGMHFAAVAPGRFAESVCYYDQDMFGAARIEINHGLHCSCVHYERVESGYSPCSRDTYIEARLNALAGLLQFFGDGEEFSTPSTRPLYVDRPNCYEMENDLPF